MRMRHQFAHKCALQVALRKMNMAAARLHSRARLLSATRSELEQHRSQHCVQSWSHSRKAHALRETAPFRDRDVAFLGHVDFYQPCFLEIGIQLAQ